MTGSGAGDAIAGAYIGDAFSYGDDRSGATIARGARLIHSAADGADGRGHTIPAHLVPDFSNKIGPLLAFCRRFLRAKSDEARSVPTETREAAVRTKTQPASNFQNGVINSWAFATADVLKKLFHAGLRRMSPTKWQPSQLCGWLDVVFQSLLGNETDAIQFRSGVRQSQLALPLLDLEGLVRKDHRDDAHGQGRLRAVDQRKRWTKFAVSGRFPA